MNNKSIIMYLLCSGIIAAVYYASGIVVRPLILPPTFAAPIWPAAGIGVSVLMLWGYRYIPAILIGEILINLQFYSLDDFKDQPTILITYSTMLIATLLRSALGKYLVRRKLGESNNYLTLLSTVKLFFYAGFVPTLLSSILSTFALFLSDKLDSNSYWVNLLTWWFGDMVGVFIILPIMLAIFKKPRNIWAPRLLKIVIPVVVTFSLLVIIALSLKKTESKRFVESLETSIATVFDNVLSQYSGSHSPHNVGSKDIKATVNDLFSSTTQKIIQENHIQDVHFIIESVSDTGNVELFKSDNKPKISKSIFAKKKYDIFDNEWIFTAYTTLDFYLNKNTWLVWWLLSIGFLFTAVLGAGMLVITGNSILVQDKVDERTKEINTLNKILSESEQKYKQLVEIQPVIFWKYVFAEPQIEYISYEASRILGYSVEELKDIKLILDEIVHPDDRESVISTFKTNSQNESTFTTKYRAYKKNGEIIWFKDFITVQKVDNNYELLGLKIDITKDEETAQKITQLAYFDTMTKLPNRTKFMSYLDNAIKKTVHNKTHGAVIYLDLDRFKVINDSMGHYFGDKLLVEIAKRLTKLLRENDIASRFGGDEFVVLLSNVNSSKSLFKEKAQHVAEKIKDVIASRFIIDGYNFHTSCSIGISMFPSDSENPDEIIQQADIAMYESKVKGKNTLSFFEPKMQHKANRRLYIEKSLKIALKNNEFEMYYQPIFDSNKETKKLEALIRWNHPNEGLMLPGGFIKIAEETGFINELSQWIIDDVFKQLANCSQQNINVLPIAINISLFQFENTHIIEELERASKKYAIDTANITIELTESIGISNFKSALIKLNKIKALGFKIAIDDFGTGYSSLNYLTQMPIDILKLDMTFVANIGIDKNSETLIETIVLMAKQLGFDLVIEGVETQEQFEFLINLGCTLFQGHLVSKAIPIDELKEILGKV